MKLSPGQVICLDTNVLLDATDEGRRQHVRATELLRILPVRGVILLFASQVLREYLVVATRKVEENGLGLSLENAIGNVKQFCRRGRLISETTDAYEKMLDWSLKVGVMGKKLHDLQILATAAQSGADILLTSYADDFPPDFERLRDKLDSVIKIVESDMSLSVHLRLKPR